jgi:hypothetical protein
VKSKTETIHGTSGLHPRTGLRASTSEVSFLRARRPLLFYVFYVEDFHEAVVYGGGDIFFFQTTKQLDGVSDGTQLIPTVLALFKMGSDRLTKFRINIFCKLIAKLFNDIITLHIDLGDLLEF